MKVCKYCGCKMDKILSFSPDGNKKFFRCSNLKCLAGSRNEKISSNDLRFGEYVIKDNSKNGGRSSEARGN